MHVLLVTKECVKMHCDRGLAENGKGTRALFANQLWAVRPIPMSEPKHEGVEQASPSKSVGLRASPSKSVGLRAVNSEQTADREEHLGQTQIDGP